MARGRRGTGRRAPPAGQRLAGAGAAAAGPAARAGPAGVAAAGVVGAGEGVAASWALGPPAGVARAGLAGVAAGASGREAARAGASPPAAAALGGERGVTVMQGCEPPPPHLPDRCLSSLARPTGPLSMSMKGPPCTAHPLPLCTPTCLLMDLSSSPNTRTCPKSTPSPLLVFPSFKVPV